MLEFKDTHLFCFVLLCIAVVIYQCAMYYLNKGKIRLDYEHKRAGMVHQVKRLKGDV